MQDIGISTSPRAHEWARSNDSMRISLAEQEAKNQTKECRIRRRQDHKDALHIMDDSNIFFADLASMIQCEVNRLNSLQLVLHLSVS